MRKEANYEVNTQKFVAGFLYKMKNTLRRKPGNTPFTVAPAVHTVPGPNPIKDMNDFYNENLKTAPDNGKTSV